MPELPPNLPSNLAEVLWYIRYYEDSIYIRRQIDGRGVNAPLSTLSLKEWGEYIQAWIEEGHVPYPHKI